MPRSFKHNLNSVLANYPPLSVRNWWTGYPLWFRQDCQLHGDEFVVRPKQSTVSALRPLHLLLLFVAYTLLQTCCKHPMITKTAPIWVSQLTPGTNKSAYASLYGITMCRSSFFLEVFLTCFAKWHVLQSLTLQPDNCIPSTCFRSTINLMYWGHTWPKRLRHNCKSATPSRAVTFITRVAKFGLVLSPDVLSPDATCPSKIHTAPTLSAGATESLFQYRESVHIWTPLKLKSIVKRTPHRQQRITWARNK